MYVVWCETTEGNGCYFGGIYRSHDRALNRMKWCSNHCLYGNDAWKISFVKAQPAEGGYYADAFDNEIEPGDNVEYAENEQ